MKKVASLGEAREKKLRSQMRDFIDDVMNMSADEEELDRRLNHISEEWEQHKESEERTVTAEKLWTPDEVAAHIHKSKKTVMQYLRAKKIVGVKVGREWMIPDSHLQAYIDSLKAAYSGKA